MIGDAISSVGFAMVCGGLIWWFRQAMRVALPENRVPFVAWMIAGGALAGVGLVLDSSWLATTLAALGILGAVFVLGTVAISRQKTTGAIAVGDTIPTFQTLDEDGEPFRSASLAGSPVLLKFFRGHW